MIVRKLFEKVRWNSDPGAGGGGSAPAAPAPAAGPAGGAPAAPATATPSSPAGGGGAVRDAQIDNANAALAAFTYDPFPDSGDGPDEAGLSSEGPAATMPGGQSGADPAAPAQPTTQDPSQNAGLAAILRMAGASEAAARAAAEAAAAATARGGTAGPTTPADEFADIPFVPLTVPAQLFAGIYSENPQERQQSLNMTMGLVHRAAVGNAVKFMRNEFARVMPQVVQHYLQQYSTQQMVYQDFYGKYPALNRPELHRMVATVAQELMQSEGHQDWNETLRDKLGATVMARLQATLGLTDEQMAGLRQAAAGGAPAGGGTVVPMRRAPTLGGGGVRPAGVLQTGREEDFREFLGM